MSILRNAKVLVFPFNAHAVGFYRSILPYLYLKQNFYKDDMIIFQPENWNPTLFSQFDLSKVEYIVIERFYDRYRSGFFNYILELKKQYNFKLIHDFDDNLFTSYFPDYNNCKKWFSLETDNLMRYFILNSDINTVTCEPLKNIFVEEASKEGGILDVRILPNFIHKSFIDYSKTNLRKSRNSKKLRIGFIGSDTHYSQNPNIDQEDDISEFEDWIIENKSKYQFVFFGGISPRLSEHHEIERYLKCVPFLQYHETINSLNLDLVVAPLADNVFNSCKSNIKMIESWASGILFAGKNIAPYAENFEGWNFSSAEELGKLVERVDGLSEQEFFELKERNFQRLLDDFTFEKSGYKLYLEMLNYK